MKYFITIFLICSFTPSVKADYIIYLKNGNESSVKNYKIINDEICFKMFGGEVCFPEKDISKIIKIEDKSESKIEIENIGLKNNSMADSYAEKAEKLYHENKTGEALEMLSKAMEYNPLETIYPKNSGIIHYNAGNFTKAGEMFAKVLEIDGKDSFAHEYSGRSYYYSNLLKKALIELNTAISLTPDNLSLIKFREKVENESKAESSFQKTSQEIFVIQYDREAEFRFTSLILDTLLEAYWRIIRDLSYYSRKEFKIPVIIYTEKAFKDFGHPEWVSAVYDGKIRIPAGGINEQKDKDLENFIYHELTHALLFYYCRGRKIPAWLNEGIAQLEEKNQQDIQSVKILIRRKHLSPLKNLEKSFSGFTDPETVRMAYLQSYLAANFILERYSKQALLDLLKYLSEDKSIEEAILKTLFVNFNQFEEKYREYILK